MFYFSVLGPLTVHRGTELAVTKSALLRRLLAVLLANANVPVSFDELAESLWAERREPTALRAALQINVHRLRQFLGDPARIEHGPAGYRIVVKPDELDLEIFERLAEQATAIGVRPDAAHLLDEALVLWKGTPFAGFEDLPGVTGTRARILQTHLSIVEQRCAIDLGSGRAAAAIDRLAPVIVAHPYREQLRGLLMRSLYQEGRQNEALGVFRETRELLLDALGIEPGPALQNLHRGILRGDPELIAVVAAPTNSLPRAVAGFVGRKDELDTLERLSAGTGATLIAAVDGIGGTGKTALALHWAHLAASRYPGGQLYVNLHGDGSREPASVYNAIVQLLRQLHVPGNQIPAAEEEAAAKLRTVVYGKNILLVLDNAATADQVRPLLPAGQAHVLITSRHLLSGLVAGHGIKRILLGSLSTAEALDLLRAIAGARRVDTELDAAERLAQLCGHLPLALRICAAHLADHPEKAIKQYLAAITGTRVLDALAIDGDPNLAVRTIFHHSFQQTTSPAQHLFVLLGLLPGPDFTTDAATALLGADATQLLGILVSANLVEAYQAGRFRLHDLLRVFAREVAQAGAIAVRGALHRVMAWYTASVWNACECIIPGTPRVKNADPLWREGGQQFSDATAALDWTGLELPNITAAVLSSTADGDLPAAAALQLTSAIRAYFVSWHEWAAWIDLLTPALRLAEQMGDKAAQAICHHDFGVAYGSLAQFGASVRHLEQAAALHRELGDQSGLTAVVCSLGKAHTGAGEYDTALGYFREGLRASQMAGYTFSEALAWTNIGYIHYMCSRFVDAIDAGLPGLALYRQLNHRQGMAVTLYQLGACAAELDRFGEARAWLDESLALSKETGDPHAEAEAIAGLAIADRRQGRLGQAIGGHEKAIAMFADLNHHESRAFTLVAYGHTLLATGDIAGAVSRWRTAHELYLQIGNGYQTTAVATLIAAHTPTESDL